MPGVCLSVCMLATLRKNYEMDLHEHFTQMNLWTSKNLLNFASHPPLDPDAGIFEGFFNTAR